MDNHIDIIKRISECAAGLSDAQRLVAEFIVKNLEKAVFLTAARLGQEVGVSESTVVRCAMALGYSGFPELQRALQEYLKTRLTTLDRLYGAKSGLEAGESILERVMRSDMEAINITLQELSREEFAKAVKAITQAKKILVIGLRSMSALSFFLGYTLNWILRNVSIISHGSGDMVEQVMCLEPGDVAVGITFPRYTRRTVELVELARKRGATTIGITDNVMSPLAPYCDILLTAKSGLLSSFVDSCVAPLSLINALITAVGAEDEARTAKALSELEPVWEEYQIYVTDKRK